MNKSALRAFHRKQRRALDPLKRTEFSQQFCQNVIRTKAFQKARHIACYWAMPEEIDAYPLIQAALETGKAVYLPVISSNKMWFCEWLGQPLSRDRKNGLSQPHKSDRRLVNKTLLDLVIVPLVAFDRRGLRIGQGGGFYDRYFQQIGEQQWKKPKLMGAAYHFQEVERIPADSWDVSLAAIVTNYDVITTQTI